MTPLSQSVLLAVALLVATAHAGWPPEPTQLPTPAIDPIMCCMALTADCMACAQDISVEDFCSNHPDTAGCAKIPIVEPEPDVCCKAQTASCMACSEGVSKKHFCHHHPTATGCDEKDFHNKLVVCVGEIIQWAIGLLILVAGLTWGFFERRRRRSLVDRPERIGGYTVGLFDCLVKPSMWFPACLFTPVLAAFNRSQVDERECSVCDVCFAMIKPVAQYTTRQSVRGRYGLASEECTDLLSACCCTPCAVAQDTAELESRSSEHNNALPAGLTAPGVPVFAMPTAQPMVYAQVSEKETYVESEMKSDCLAHAENQV